MKHVTQPPPHPAHNPEYLGSLCSTLLIGWVSIWDRLYDGMMIKMTQTGNFWGYILKAAWFPQTNIIRIIVIIIIPFNMWMSSDMAPIKQSTHFQKSGHESCTYLILNNSFCMLSFSYLATYALHRMSSKNCKQFNLSFFLRGHS